MKNFLLGPFDKSREVPLGLDVLADAKVPGSLLEERIHDPLGLQLLHGERRRGHLLPNLPPLQDTTNKTQVAAPRQPSCHPSAPYKIGTINKDKHGGAAATFPTFRPNKIQPIKHNEGVAPLQLDEQRQYGIVLNLFNVVFAFGLSVYLHFHITYFWTLVPYLRNNF